MSKYTILGKSVLCPLINQTINLSVKYYFDDVDNDTLHFGTATCPIVENSKLPPYEQDEEYKYLRCLNSKSCKLLSQFPQKLNCNDHL